MAIIKRYSPYEGLSQYQTFITDTDRNSEFFRVSEFKETLTGGKNGFLIAGHPQLKESTEVKIEVLDAEGNTVYVEPGSGIPEYYEGTSTLISIHVYDDTPIGMGKVTILGELKETWSPEAGFEPVPEAWRNTYNVKWEREVMINRLVLNEDRVRFYKRPLVSITEIVKPLFSITTPIIEQSGSLVGIAQTPDAETDLTNWRAGTLYQLRITDDSNFSSSIDENVINIPSLGYSPVIKEVLNNKEALVTLPYTENNVVKNFPTTSYNSQFEYIEGQELTNESLIGSFANIKINQLKTFVGDVARVKVFAKSRNETGDFQLLQDAKLESSEMLRDLTVQSTTEISYGKFTEYNLENYWVSSSNDHPISLNVDKLQNSVFVDYDSIGGGTQKLITIPDMEITEGIEYTLAFKYLFNGTLEPYKKIKAYLSSSDDIYEFMDESADSTNTVRTNFNGNIIADKTSNMKLVIETVGDDWYFSDVSLRNAQETSFSPDEFVLVNTINRQLDTETFDFKFEFYDINNNFIPVNVLATKIFDGGNLTDRGGAPFVILTADKSAFRFASGSFGNPLEQLIQFDVQLNSTSGSTIWSSGAYDDTGTLLTNGDYPSGGYPGLLTNTDNYNADLTIGAFTGSEDGITVSTITYTATVDGLDANLTIGRYEDGNDVSTLLVKSDRNQFYYEDASGDLEPAGQEITMRAERKNLSATNNNIIATSGSGVPPLTVVSDAGGVRTYRLLGSSYPYATGESTYTFASDDQFGTTYTDSVIVSPVRNASGATGSAGLDARAVKLTAPYYTIVYDQNGENPQTSSMYLTASAQNFNAAYFKFTGDGVVDDTSYTIGTGDFDFKEFTIPTEYFSVPMDVQVGVADGNQNELAYDTINIFAVRPGDDGSSTEFYYIKPKNGTQIKNNSGSLELQAMWSSGSTLTELNSGDWKLYDQQGNVLTVGGGVTAGVNGVEYNAFLDPTAILGSTVISLKSGSETFDTVTLVDVTDGLAAGSIISNNLLTRRDSGSAIYAPEFLYATASFYGSEGNNYLEYLTIDPYYSSSEQLDYMSWSLQLNNPNITVAVNDGDFGSVPEGVYSATKDLNVVFTFTDPTQINSITTAQETFYIISDGQDGKDSFTIFLTNESHTYPADENAYVNPADLADGSFQIRCFKGINQYTTGSGTDTYSITNIVESGITGSFSTDSGQAKYTPSEVNLGVVSGTVTFTVHANEENLDFDKTYSFSKSIKGVDGFGSEFYYIKPLRGTQIKNSSGTLELQAVAVSGSDISDITSPGNVQMYSGSVLLNTGMTGVTAGTNGVTINPIFDASAIEGSLIITLKDGVDDVDSVTLIDTGDGIPAGTVIANNLLTRRAPGASVYTPTELYVTASFYNSAGTEYVEYLTLSASYTDPTDYWHYVIDSDNPNISVVCNDGDGTDYSGPGFGNRLPTKDINTLFTFVDPIRGDTITAQETFYIVSDGADGIDGLDGKDGVSITQAPPVQSVVRSNLGVYGTPVAFTVSVVEAATTYTYDDTVTYGNGTFRIENIVGGTNGNDGTVTPTTPTTLSGTTVTFDVIYTTTAGIEVTSPQTHLVAVVNDGADGLNGSSGSNAQVVSLTATKYTVPYDEFGSIINSDNIYFTASAQGIDAPVQYQFYRNGATVQGWDTNNEYTYTPNGSVPGPGNTDLIQVDVRSDGGPTVAFDNTDVFGVQDAPSGGDGVDGVDGVNGADGYTTFLTNEAHTFSAPSSSGYSGVSYAGSEFEVRMFKGTQQFTYDGSSPYNANSYRVSSVVDTGITTTQSTVTSQRKFTQSDLSADQGSITLNIIDNATGTTFPKTYTFGVSRKGVTGAAGTDGVDGVDGVNGAPGANGPGIVHTGLWDTDRVYQYDLSDGVLRRDSVLYNNVYYATKQPAGTSVGTPDANPTYWQSLGSGDFFVSAKIAIFEQSYVQETLNVGTNVNGGVSAANITLAGGTTNPYISIDQSGTIGLQGYAVGSGIFLGMDSGTAKMSMEGASGYLRWNGSTLSINGSISFTNSPPISTFNNDTGFTDDTAANAAQSTANTAISDASAAQSTANTANSTANAVSSDLQDVIDGVSVSGTGTFIDANVVYSPLIAGTNGYISNIFKVGNGGITLDGPNKKIFTGTGTYGNSNTPFYVDNASNFSLGNKLTWNNTTLSVNGTITATNGFIGGWNINTSDISSIGRSGGSDGGFTTAGIMLHDTGYISAEEFYIASNGNAVFKGAITGGTLSIGSSNDIFRVNANGDMWLGNAVQGSAPFQVSRIGNLVATSALIQGAVSASSGEIGSWVIDNSGGLKSSDGVLILDANEPAIRILESDGGSIRLDLHKGNLSSTIGASQVYDAAAFTSGPEFGLGSPGPTTPFDEYGAYTSTFSLAAGSWETQGVVPTCYNAVGYMPDSVAGPWGWKYGIQFVSSSGEIINEFDMDGISGYQTSTGHGGFSWNTFCSGENKTGYITLDYDSDIKVRAFTRAYGSSGCYTNSKSVNPVSVTLSKNLNFTEITDSGFQVVQNANTYVRIQRTSVPLVIKDTDTAQGVEIEANIKCNDDGQYDLGTTGNRWSRLYVDLVTETSDERSKHAISGSMFGLDFINKLNPVQYKKNKAETPRLHFGLIAQEVESTVNEYSESMDTVGLVYKDLEDGSFDYDRFAAAESGSEEWISMNRDYEAIQDGNLSLKYTEFIAPMIKSIQELSSQNQDLLQRIKDLEDKLP